jgi:hypothetical protein
MTTMDAMREVLKAETLKDVVEILQRVRPPIAWATEQAVRDLLPVRPNIQTIRQSVVRMLGHLRTRQEEAERNEELNRREAAWRAAQGRGRKTRKTKRKHFRKRTSRKH